MSARDEVGARSHLPCDMWSSKLTSIIQLRIDVKVFMPLCYHNQLHVLLNPTTSRVLINFSFN